MAHGGPRSLGVGAIELVADRAKLTLLELTDGESAPAIGRADDGGVHQRQYGALAEACGMILRAPAFLEEEPLEEVRGARITRR